MKGQNIPILDSPQIKEETDGMLNLGFLRINVKEKTLERCELKSWIRATWGRSSHCPDCSDRCRGQETLTSACPTLSPSPSASHHWHLLEARDQCIGLYPWSSGKDLEQSDGKMGNIQNSSWDQLFWVYFKQFFPLLWYLSKSSVRQ